MAIILNTQQEIIKNQAVEWFRSGSSQVFEIDGAAGTGKSVLIGEILKELNLSMNEYYPMAYTGQAAIVMRTKGFLNARSIHSTLYEVVDVVVENGEKINKAFGIPTVKKEFRLRNYIESEVRLFFIDEAYMVPNWMVKDILSFGVKVIVAGDAHQLPPVGADPGFLTGYGIHHLTQLMRQAESNPIVYLANRAMHGLPIHNGSYGNEVLVINDDDFIPQMIGFADCICCGTNRTREIMNSYVRQLGGFGGNTPRFGERIICRKNNWDNSIDGISLANGLTGTVVSDVNPASFSKNGKTFKLNFKPDLINGIFTDLDVNFEYLNSNTTRKNEMKASFDAKWISGEFFDYAYCLTTHLAQGAEFPNLVFIEEFMQKQMQNQYIYTGITRAKNKLIYVRKQKKQFLGANF